MCYFYYQNPNHEILNIMRTISNKLYHRLSLLFLAIILPLTSFADAKADQLKADERLQMYMEIACIVVFVAAVAVFLVWKNKHDRQLREKQMEQMKKVQAAKRRAA